MALNSAIRWCKHTWNPWQGCHRISEECDHCYMYRDKAGTACFVKQLGKRLIIPNDSTGQWPNDGDDLWTDDKYRPTYQGEPMTVGLRDSKGGNPDEWPADLRVRQFPALFKRQEKT